MGTIARHNTQNGQKCCDSHSPFKRTVHKGYNFPCSTVITEIVRRRHRRISVPVGLLSEFKPPIPPLVYESNACGARPWGDPPPSRLGRTAGQPPTTTHALAGPSNVLEERRRAKRSGEWVRNPKFLCTNSSPNPFFLW